MTLNSSNSTNNQQSSFNFFLLATDECLLRSNKSFCNYIAFIVVISQFLFTFVFPFIWYRLRVLNQNYRNQYNLSFVWLLSIFALISIDIIEFLLFRNGQIYSVTIIFFNVCQLIGCSLCIMRFRRVYADFDKQNNFKILITIGFIVFVLITRVLIVNYSKDSENASFYTVNNNLLLYFVIFSVFSMLQVNFHLCFL
jgi:hypothetical protein